MAEFKVLHDKDGNHHIWTYGAAILTNPYEFNATLKYAGFERGRSALNIVWEDVKTGKQYRSGMKLLDDSLNDIDTTIACPGAFRIKGIFGFKKQGTSVLLTRL